LQKDYVITVFTMTHCPACVSLKRWFKANDIPFIEKDIVTNEEYEKEFLEHKLKYTPTTFIKTDDEEHQIVGASYKKIEKILSTESTARVNEVENI